MNNQRISDIFNEISLFLQMDNVAFKPRAYEKAAHSIAECDTEIAELYQKKGLKGLMELPAVGKSMAKKIEELLKKNKMVFYQKLKKKYPIDVLKLTAIEGIGPKTAKELYEKLGIKNISDLKDALKNHDLKQLPRFGPKNEDNIAKSISYFEKTGNKFIYGFIEPEIYQFVEDIKKLSGEKNIFIAGSCRRMKDLITDLDLVASPKNPKKLIDFFIKHPKIIDMLAKGKTKVMVRLDNGLDVDMRIIKPENFGAAMLYFTGSREHTLQLRKIAQQQGYKLNEYGLYKNNRQIAGKTESQIYHKLGMPLIPPELRQGTDEFELKNPPRLIRYGDLKGDLQVQTEWTDGEHSIEEMALQAINDGLEYINITDHTKILSVAGGLNEAGIAKQSKEINRINKKLNGKIRILKGSEVNILKDGKLDINDKALSKLDIVGAAVHSHYNLTKKQMTDRICTAMENPHVDIIFHPTGRRIQHRRPYELDINRIIETAKKTGTVLEIDAYPSRLDLKDVHIKKAVAAGVRMSIDTDAHHKNHFSYLKYGIGQARRGGAKKKDIINAWPVEKMLTMLKNN